MDLHGSRGGVEGVVHLAMTRFASPGIAAADRTSPPPSAAGWRRWRPAAKPAAAPIRDVALAGRLGDIACPTPLVTGIKDTSTPFARHGEHLRRRGPRRSAPSSFCLRTSTLAPRRKSGGCRRSRRPCSSHPFAGSIRPGCARSARGPNTASWPLRRSRRDRSLPRPVRHPPCRAAAWPPRCSRSP